MQPTDLVKFHLLVLKQVKLLGKESSGTINVDSTNAMWLLAFTYDFVCFHGT